ncbi:MAG: DUF2752 domain-containing protein [Marmoricola sp.]|nr:DUF2752 domain-containing protein [Marmoricola sp.]
MATLTDPTSAALPATRRERLTGPLVVAGVVVAGTVALHVRDPHASGSWGYCPWKLLTGMDCPGCGTLRAVNDLTNGHLVAAASSNLLFVVMVPVMVAMWASWARRSWRGTPRHARSASATTTIWAAAVVVTVVFTVLRNTPWGSWLHS